MKPGDKIKCMSTFKSKEGEQTPIKDIVYTVKLHLIANNLPCITVQEFQSYNKDGKQWVWYSGDFELLDGPFNGSGRPNDIKDKPNWVIPNEIKEQRPFYML